MIPFFILRKYQILFNKIIKPKIQININKKFIGDNYGGYYIHPDELNKQSIIYCSLVFWLLQ